MQSNNPVFRNSDAFNGRGTNAYGNQTYPGNGAGFEGYGQSPTGYADPQAPVRSGERMTIDSVVQKTGISLGIVVIVAALTWWFTPPITGDPESMGPLLGAMTIGSLAAFGLSMVNSFKRVISPALVMAFCVAEGVALGALSKFFDALLRRRHRHPGGDRYLRGVRRHAGGLQVLQHQGRAEVPHLRHRRRLRHGRRWACSRWCSASSTASSASSASVAWACCSRSSAWCSASSC